MTINDFSLGDKFQYLGRETMCVPYSRFSHGYAINAVDIKTGSTLHVPKERQLQPIEVHFSYAARDSVKRFDKLFIGDKFFYDGELLVKCNSFVNARLDRVDAFCLTDGKMYRVWGNEEVFPAYEIKKEYSR